MFDIFNKRKITDEGKSARKSSRATPRKVSVSMSTEEYVEFQRTVVETKKAIIDSIERIDKAKSLENIKRLSNLSAKAIYNHNLRQIVVIDEAVTEIKNILDAKLTALKAPNYAADSIEETQRQVLIKLSLIPVCAMLNAIEDYSNTAIGEANEEIDAKIQEVQKFLMDYESSLSKI